MECIGLAYKAGVRADIDTTSAVRCLRRTSWTDLGQSSHADQMVVTCSQALLQVQYKEWYVVKRLQEVDDTML